MRHLLLFMALIVPAFGGMIGPTPYLSQADSPFLQGSPSYSYFYLENFEDGALNTPGVSMSGNSLSILTPGGSFNDSVDGDDGLIDGSGVNGRSLYTPFGSTGITFTFNSLQIVLPTVAGIVWTDLSGSADVYVEAFDAANVSLGVLGPYALNDGFSTGQTAEDRFFGFTNAGGISRLVIYQSGSDMEVDHLQYGAALTGVPEPAAMGLMGVGLAVLMALRLGRK